MWCDGGDNRVTQKRKDGRMLDDGETKDNKFCHQRQAYIRGGLEDECPCEGLLTITWVEYKVEQ